MNLTEFAAPFLGDHTGTNRLWFQPGNPEDSQPIRLHGAWALDGRFLRLTYTSESTGKPVVGELLVGYDPRVARAEANWIDTFHMSKAMLHVTGPAAATGILALTGDYFAAEGHPRWGWRIDLIPAEPCIRMYNIPPGEEGVLGVEFQLGK